jgi:hypothetical protein
VPVVITGTPNTNPQKQLPDVDLGLLIAAQSAELAVRDLYNEELAVRNFSDEQQSVLELFRDHHTTYAQALNGVLGKSSTTTRNESLFSSYANHGRSIAESLTTLQSLENILVATHTVIVGSLIDLDAVNLMASILMVEARHAAVFGTAPTLNLEAALNDVAQSLVASDTVGG